MLESIPVPASSLDPASLPGGVDASSFCGGAAASYVVGGKVGTAAPTNAFAHGPGALHLLALRGREGREIHARQEGARVGLCSRALALVVASRAHARRGLAALGPASVHRRAGVAVEADAARVRDGGDAVVQPGNAERFGSGPHEASSSPASAPLPPVSFELELEHANATAAPNATRMPACGGRVGLALVSPFGRACPHLYRARGAREHVSRNGEGTAPARFCRARSARGRRGRRSAPARRRRPKGEGLSPGSCRDRWNGTRHLGKSPRCLGSGS